MREISKSIGCLFKTKNNNDNGIFFFWRVGGEAMLKYARAHGISVCLLRGMLGWRARFSSRCKIAF